MDLTTNLSTQIVAAARQYLGREYVWGEFDCVTFVRDTYRDVGIDLPTLNKHGYPPPEFHLSETELVTMPVGHSVFLKRRASKLNRIWTHVAIIISKNELIHCSRNIGKGVVVTQSLELLSVYAVAAQPPS